MLRLRKKEVIINSSPTGTKRSCTNDYNTKHEHDAQTHVWHYTVVTSWLKLRLTDEINEFTTDCSMRHVDNYLYIIYVNSNGEGVSPFFRFTKSHTLCCCNFFYVFYHVCNALTEKIYSIGMHIIMVPINNSQYYRC